MSKERTDKSQQFDAERAKNGEAVQWLNQKGEWEDISNSDLYLFHGLEDKLRMKKIKF
jgi:hypothetical protein